MNRSSNSFRRPGKEAERGDHRADIRTRPAYATLLCLCMSAWAHQSKRRAAQHTCMLIGQCSLCAGETDNFSLDDFAEALENVPQASRNLPVHLGGVAPSLMHQVTAPLQGPAASAWRRMACSCTSSSRTTIWVPIGGHRSYKAGAAACSLAA